MEFAIPISNFMKHPNNRQKYFRKASPDYPAPYYAFIMERLFTTYMQLRSNHKRICFPFEENWLYKHVVTEEEYFMLKKAITFIDYVDGRPTAYDEKSVRKLIGWFEENFRSLAERKLYKSEQTNLFRDFT